MSLKRGVYPGHTLSKIQRKCGKRTKKKLQKRTTLSTGLLYQKFEPKTLGIATLWTGVWADIAIKHFAVTRSLQPVAAHHRHSYIKILNNSQITEFFLWFLSKSVAFPRHFERKPRNPGFPRFYGAILWPWISVQSLLVPRNIMVYNTTIYLELYCGMSLNSWHPC